jgi:hypothetical protein
MIQARNLRKHVYGLILLIIFAISLIGYYSLSFRQPYACSHMDLNGTVLFCIMQFRDAMVVLLMALIALAGLLAYSLAKRKQRLTS